MTKAELEKENRTLKSTIRELQKTAKVASEVLDGLDDVGYGIAVVDAEGTKRLAMVKINFDLEKKCAIIDQESLISGRTPDVNLKLREAVWKEVVKRDKEIKRG